jgi:hypothetical protein
VLLEEDGQGQQDREPHEDQSHGPAGIVKP